VTDGILSLALVGARARGFQHDLASKLQGLMIAVDEVAEHNAALGDPRLARAVDAAMLSLRDVQSLLAAFRALARGADPRPCSLRELISSAARSAGVAATDAVPDLSIHATPGAAAQALSLAFDLADPDTPVRVEVAARDTIAIAVPVRAGDAELDLDRGEAVEVMRFALARDGGDARDAGDRLVLQFRLASDDDQPL
jgi:hypothetical protein